MKKIVSLATLCVLIFTASAHSSSQPVKSIVQPTIDVQSIFSGEPQPHPQTIYVKTRINGNTVLLPVLVFFTDLVLWVKMDVASILDIPLDSFELTFGGAVLNEELTLNDYGITTKSILGVRYN